MKNRSIFFTVLSVFITGAAGFIASIFLSGAPLAVVCCTAALAVFNLIWFMRFDRESDSQARTAVDTFAEKEGQWNKMIQFLSGLRNNSKELNGRVSKSLDAAIIAGGRIGENIRSVEKKTHGLHEQISGASSASEEITATIRHCGMELEKHEQSITQTGTAIEEINANVHSVAAITKQKMSALEQLKDTIGTGAQRVNHTGQSIAEVTSLVNEISGVIQVINTVAAQTNLLSMNAAIEAAHAGEAGKGFAVVADEVRKLAESTAKNSKSISDSIKNIVNKIEEAKKASTVAGETFANIQNETNTFVGAFDEISRAASELSVGMDQILKSITSVKEFSGEIARGAKEMTAGSQNIDEALRQMKDYSQEILNDLEEITHDASDLTGSQSGISQFAVDNNKSMAALYKELETGGFLEKDGLAFNYDLIVLMHRNWLAQLRAFLDDRKENLTVTDKDYLNCDLGKWIYGEGKQYQDNEHYRTLEKQHQRFHGLAGEIYNAKKRGDKIKAEALYKSLMAEYKEVVSLLGNMNQTLNKINYA